MQITEQESIRLLNILIEVYQSIPKNDYGDDGKERHSANIDFIDLIKARLYDDEVHRVQREEYEATK
tara:strand:+ start:7061 stop:7261 length:201 start_codon:yes stop_codon:yes gene_type:complete